MKTDQKLTIARANLAHSQSLMDKLHGQTTQTPPVATQTPQNSPQEETPEDKGSIIKDSMDAVARLADAIKAWASK